VTVARSEVDFFIKGLNNISRIIDAHPGLSWEGHSNISINRKERASLLANGGQDQPGIRALGGGVCASLCIENISINAIGGRFGPVQMGQVLEQGLRGRGIARQSRPSRLRVETPCDQWVRCRGYWNSRMRPRE
jgi:hypothetical protein